MINDTHTNPLDAITGRPEQDTPGRPDLRACRRDRLASPIASLGASVSTASRIRL